MRQISSEIIKDLLPLYGDEVCSKESAAIVEEHLAECHRCQIELDSIKADVSLPEDVVEENYSDSHALKGIAISWKRAKLKAFVKGLIGAILLSIAIIGGMVLFQWDIMKVSSEVVEVSEVSKLSDGYGLDRAKFVMNENGDFYWTPLRPIIKSKSKFDIGLQNTYNTFGEIEKHYYREKYGANAEIKALYIGTSDDPVLVWKKGMALPPASDEAEAYFADLH